MRPPIGLSYTSHCSTVIRSVYLSMENNNEGLMTIWGGSFKFDGQSGNGIPAFSIEAIKLYTDSVRFFTFQKCKLHITIEYSQEHEKFVLCINSIIIVCLENEDMQNLAANLNKLKNGEDW